MSPEDKLILSSVKITPDKEDLERINGLIPLVHDWDYLATTIAERGIAPLLFKKLPYLSNNVLVPTDVKTKLQQLYYRTMSRSMVLYEHFRKITAALSAHNIPLIALKGIYLSEWLYEDIGLRQMSDIDILVKKEDGEKCLAVLAELGYRPESDEAESELEKKLDLIHYSPMVMNGVAVEVHIKLHQRIEKYDLNVERLWENAIPVTINGNEVFTLAANDLLIYICIHLHRHFHQGHVQFTSFSDITNLLEKYAGTFDWDGFIATCREYRCEEVVFTYIVLANKYMHANVPEGIIQKYSHFLSKNDELLFCKYLNGYVGFTSGMPKHFGNLYYLDSFGDKARYVWEILFPTKAFMVAKFNIKRPFLLPFYYPYRYYLGLKGIFIVLGRKKSDILHIK
jgi:hypothetical protein